MITLDCFRTSGSEVPFFSLLLHCTSLRCMHALLLSVVFRIEEACFVLCKLVYSVSVGLVAFRLIPFRLVPFRLDPFRLGPFRLVTFHLVSFRLVAG